MADQTPTEPPDRPPARPPELSLIAGLNRAAAISTGAIVREARDLTDAAAIIAALAGQAARLGRLAALSATGVETPTGGFAAAAGECGRIAERIGRLADLVAATAPRLAQSAETTAALLGETERRLNGIRPAIALAFGEALRGGLGPPTHPEELGLPLVPDRRRHQRHAVHAMAGIVIGDPAARPRPRQAPVVNLSEGGAAIALASRAAAIGAPVALRFDAREPVAGRIVGRSAGVTHVAFAPGQRERLEAIRQQIGEDRMRHIDDIRGLAGRIEAALEAAIAEGRADVSGLIAPRYGLVGGERLVQSPLDPLFAGVVAPILAEGLSFSEPADLRVIDRAGYVPLVRDTGDLPDEMRPGRLVTDPVWLRACRSTGPHLIEVERRALKGMGRLMMHLSAPIHVRGAHWGCVAAAIPL